MIVKKRNTLDAFLQAWCPLNALVNQHYIDSKSDNVWRSSRNVFEWVPLYRCTVIFSSGYRCTVIPSGIQSYIFMMYISFLFFSFSYNLDFYGITVQRYMEWTRVWSLSLHTVESAFFLKCLVNNAMEWYHTKTLPVQWYKKHIPRMIVKK
jgi:hypothetical protein